MTTGASGKRASTAWINTFRNSRRTRRTKIKKEENDMTSRSSEPGKMRATADREKRELLFERTFNAPRDRVWQAWTDPERLAQWWGPKGWTTTIYKFEARPGGIWHYCMRG